jgi:hypothetical protein
MIKCNSRARPRFETISVHEYIRNVRDYEDGPVKTLERSNFITHVVIEVTPIILK